MENVGIFYIWTTYFHSSDFVHSSFDKNWLGTLLATHLVTLFMSPGGFLRSHGLIIETSSNCSDMRIKLIQNE
jgi:hypothetical protein